MSTPPIELDLRPIFAAERPPLGAILAAVNRLEPDQALRLIAPFEPLRLYELLAPRGLVPTARELPDGAWEIVFEHVR